MAKILIADDSELTRNALKTFLVMHEGWVVCGEAVDGREAVSMAAELKPDAIVLDMSMPVLTGIEAALEILKRAPAMPIILYTLHKNQQLEQEALRTGIRKVVAKVAQSDELIPALEEILGSAESVIGPLGMSTVISAPQPGGDLIVNPESTPQPNPDVSGSEPSAD